MGLWFAVNGTRLVNEPFNTLFKCFTDLIGNAFWLIPIGFIATALYIKTHDITGVGVFLLAGGAILGSGNIFTGQPELAFIYFMVINSDIKYIF